MSKPVSSNMQDITQQLLDQQLLEPQSSGQTFTPLPLDFQAFSFPISSSFPSLDSYTFSSLTPLTETIPGALPLAPQFSSFMPFLPPLPTPLPTVMPFLSQLTTPLPILSSQNPTHIECTPSQEESPLHQKLQEQLKILQELNKQLQNINDKIDGLTAKVKQLGRSKEKCKNQIFLAEEHNKKAKNQHETLKTEASAQKYEQTQTDLESAQEELVKTSKSFNSKSSELKYTKEWQVIKIQQIESVINKIQSLNSQDSTPTPSTLDASPTQALFTMPDPKTPSTLDTQTKSPSVCSSTKKRKPKKPLIKRMKKTKSSKKNRDLGKKSRQISSLEPATIAQGVNKGQKFAAQLTQSKTDSSGSFSIKPSVQPQTTPLQPVALLSSPMPIPKKPPVPNHIEKQLFDNRISFSSKTDTSFSLLTDSLTDRSQSSTPILSVPELSESQTSSLENFFESSYFST